MLLAAVIPCGVGGSNYVVFCTAPTVRDNVSVIARSSNRLLAVLLPATEEVGKEG